MKAIRPLRTIGLVLVLALTFSCVRYQARPLVPAGVMDDFEARRLDSAELGTFLVANKEAELWPPNVWDLKALTFVALYFHPDMDIARAQWGVASAGRITAGERPNPTLTPIIGYNTTSPRSEISPWIPEAALELTIETAGKRGIRVAEARHRAAAARWQIFSAAWSVRKPPPRRPARGLRVRREGGAHRRAGEAPAGIRPPSRAPERGRRGLGIRSHPGADRARREPPGRHRSLASRGGGQGPLAAALGLPRRALEGVSLSFDGFLRPGPDLPAGQIRRQALLNRSDILAALAEYEASQSALKLEIAKQYPDISSVPTISSIRPTASGRSAWDSFCRSSAATGARSPRPWPAARRAPPGSWPSSPRWSASSTPPSRTAARPC